MSTPFELVAPTWPGSVGKLTNLVGIPKADGNYPTWYADFTTGRYVYEHPLLGPPTKHSSFSDWLTELSGTFTRTSDATYYNSSGILTTASSNELRFDYDPVTNVPKGILLEGARTNLFTYSGDLTNAVFDYTSNVTVTGGFSAPDGSSDAVRVYVDSLASTACRRETGTLSDGNHTYTVFAKKGSGNNELNKFGVYDHSAPGDVVFAGIDYDTGGVFYFIGSSGVSTEDTGNGWWRVSVTWNATSGHNYSVYFGGTSAPEPAGEFAYFWGTQFEVGSFASSYIPTEGTTATRAADSLTFPTSPWFGSANSILLKGRTPPGVDTEQILFSVDDGTADERIRVSKQSDGNIHVVVTAGGVTQADLDMGAVAADTDFALMFRFAANDFAASLDGGTVVTDTSGSMPTGITTARIGSGLASGEEWSSTCAVGGIWASSVSNSELQRLTT